MTEPLPVYAVAANAILLAQQGPLVDALTKLLPPETPEDITPTYSDLAHYASIGRRLTQAAGFVLADRPPASAVFLALKALGAAEALSQSSPLLLADD